MAKLAVIRDDKHSKMLSFPCPGCKCDHWIRTRGPDPKWDWNEDLEQPTVTPSLDIQERGDSPKHCHLVITEGKLKFLGDCTHVLAGKTVDMEDVD